jgi:MGT family glycosyltransferase
VYATLGTIFNLESGDLVERLITAGGLIDGDVLVTTGPFLAAADLPAAAPRVQVAEFVPQEEVLPGAGAVVCHGGSGTLVAALALGVPVVVLPMGADQPDNADRVAELGVGIVLDALTATPAEIAAATTAVLDDDRYRAAASELAREAAAQPPVADVDELLMLLG